MKRWGCGTKRWWPNWRYNHNIHVVEIQNTMNNLAMAAVRTDIRTRISRAISIGILKLGQTISKRFRKKAVVPEWWYSARICQKGRKKTVTTSVKTAGNTVEQI